MLTRDDANINEALLKSVQEDLIITHPELIVRGLMEEDARERLRDVVKREHRAVVGRDEDLIDYIVQETVGTGVIEEIIKDENVTDIGYNGSELIIEGSDFKEVYKGSQEITENYIVRIVQKFANAVGKDFTPKEPILDAVFGTIRLNAVHKSRSGLIPQATTMSMRIVRPRLVLHEGNFNTFAPHYMLDFFKRAVGIKTNISIAGETGTGKTELQKLLMSFVNNQDKLIMIEDVSETHAKELFPEKDVYSWLTSEGTTISDLVKAGLRNNPRWIMVAETRGEEAYELIQSVLSGHKLITSLHAVSASAIPRRLVTMAKIGYDIVEKDLEEDVRRYFDLGLLISRAEYNGKTVRYLSEVIEFGLEEDTVIFEQKFIDGRFESKTGVLTDNLRQKMEDEFPGYQFKEDYEETRYLNEIKEEIEDLGTEGKG